jgi:hypothetical protein
MEGREKPHMVKYKEIMNYWNYDASCMLTSLPVLDLENFKHLIFVAQCVCVCVWLKYLIHVKVLTVNTASLLTVDWQVFLLCYLNNTGLQWFHCLRHFMSSLSISAH